MYIYLRLVALATMLIASARGTWDSGGGLGRGTRAGHSGGALEASQLDSYWPRQSDQPSSSVASSPSLPRATWKMASAARRFRRTVSSSVFRSAVEASLRTMQDSVLPSTIPQEPRPTFRTLAAWRWTNRSRARPYAILGDLTGWSFSICCLRPPFGRGSCPSDVLLPGERLVGKRIRIEHLGKRCRAVAFAIAQSRNEISLISWGLRGRATPPSNMESSSRTRLQSSLAKGVFARLDASLD